MSAISEHAATIKTATLQESLYASDCALSEARDALAKANELIAALEARNEDLERRDARQRVRISELEGELRDANMVINCLPASGKTIDEWLP